MSQTQEPKMQERPTDNVGLGSYIVAGIGFIPLVGIPFACISIVLGLIKFSVGGKRLVAMGISGIALSIFLYSNLFYFGFVQRHGMFDDMRVKLSHTVITNLVKDIEYYKVLKEHYPEKLQDLSDSSKFAMYYDPATVRGLVSKELPYFYQLTDDKSHYYLLGIGDDQLPFTSDDILPDLSEAERARTGLLVKRVEAQ